MTFQLTPDEKRYLDALLAWDERRRPAESIAAQISLVFGGLLIAVAAGLTVLDLRDVTILEILIPGFLGGLFLIALYVVGRARVDDRHQIAILARKLTRTT